MQTFISLPWCLEYMNRADDLASIGPAGGGVKISLSVSMSTSTSVSVAFPVLTRAYMSPLSHFTSQGGAALASARVSARRCTPAAVCSAASTVRCASSRARSAAALACFETFDRNHETAAPTIVKTAHTAMTTFAADSKSSSSVRCGGCTASCGLAGVTHLTGEGAIRGADGSSSSASSSAYSGGAGGDRGLPGASAHTLAGHTVQVSKYKVFARPEVGVRRG